MDFDKTCFSVFKDRCIDPEALTAHRRQLRGYTALLICITPRSGSSLLADLLRATGHAGMPAEYLAHRQMAKTLQGLEKRDVKIDNLMQYMRWLLESRTANNVLAVKASYFQYQPIIAAGLESALFGSPALVYLSRRNIVLQAISMYLASTTRLFHAPQAPGKDSPSGDADVAYDNEAIREWIRHIHTQEKGWERYFADAAKPVLRIDYDQLKADVQGVVDAIFAHAGIEAGVPVALEESAHKKLGSDLNARFFVQFVGNDANRHYLKDLGIDEIRLSGS